MIQLSITHQAASYRETRYPQGQAEEVCYVVKKTPFTISVTLEGPSPPTPVPSPAPSTLFNGNSSLPSSPSSPHIPFGGVTVKEEHPKSTLNFLDGVVSCELLYALPDLPPVPILDQEPLEFESFPSDDGIGVLDGCHFLFFRAIVYSQVPNPCTLHETQ